ncbi:MAG TPA: glycine dehydrogenase subunit 2 [Bacteroidetes bacterium]|nr:glycine dehydrogenase subunit 2 [Bacteroidota bacterium]HEX04129.1 glycine dehydrogenase subunit 2 [Bacteroidota bacterium]
MQNAMPEKLLYELSVPDQRGVRLPKSDVPLAEPLPIGLRRAEDAPLSEVSENEIIRHFHRLSNLNHHVDRDFYPLGSCTMKYNPKVNEKIVNDPHLSELHPFTPTRFCQGALEVLYELGEQLKAITGFAGVTLQPPAGASGELTGLLMMRKYHTSQNDNIRKRVIIPDSAHGTNPATIHAAGCEVIELKSGPDGTVDTEEVRKVADERLVGMMITNPNTLGIFESNIREISKIVHRAGGFMYMDGANLNALLGITTPAKMGFDVMHINVHKTFSTPHGGGGPGAGPVCCVEKLEPYLPTPVVRKEENIFFHDWARPKSIGKMQGYFGNFLILARAYAYILANGKDGLQEVSQAAIINANYLRILLQSDYDIPFPDRCLHEVVLSADKQAKQGARALDIAKRLLDFGIHAPTIYFPQIVHEAMMIEPTETETKETLDRFVDIMRQIAKEAEEKPEFLHDAPYTTPI